MEPNTGTEVTGADNECTDVPRAERLVFMKHAGYKNGVKCIYDNDTFTGNNVSLSWIHHI